MKYFVLITVACSAISAMAQYAPSAPPATGVVGYWSTDAGSVLDIDTCGAAVCIKNGKIYDPETGKTYKAVISSTGNTLSVRGYIGFKALGRSETWKRTSAEYATCVGTTHR